MSDARHIRELEARCQTLERAFLVQEKRVWSLNMLKRLEEGSFLREAPATERQQTQELLAGNLRVAQEVLDDLARELGYESPSVFRLLDPEFVYGAPGPEVGPELTEQLERVDAREREAGTSHVSGMLRELKTRHDAFLSELAARVREDVNLQALLLSMSASLEPPGAREEPS